MSETNDLTDVVKSILADEFEALKAEIDRIGTVLDGNEAIDVVGLRVRVRKVEGLVSGIVNERQTQKTYIKGLGAGLALLGVTSAGTLFTVLSQLVE